MNYLTTSYMQAIPLAISSLSLLLSYRTARLDITVPFEAVSQSSLLALISQLPHIFSKENPSGFGLTCTSGRVHFWVKRKKKSHLWWPRPAQNWDFLFFVSTLFVILYTPHSQRSQNSVLRSHLLSQLWIYLILSTSFGLQVFVVC